MIDVFLLFARLDGLWQQPEVMNIPNHELTQSWTDTSQIFTIGWSIAVPVAVVYIPQPCLYMGYCVCMQPTGSMYGISTYSFHKNPPFMQVNIPVPWILWAICLSKPQLNRGEHWWKSCQGFSHWFSVPWTSVIRKSRVFAVWNSFL